nr:RdRp [Erysiphe necator associated mitovirus 2]
MMNPFIRLGSLLIGKTTKELILGLYSMIKVLHKIGQVQSLTGLALYLKASSTYLMKAWSLDPLLDQKAFGPVVGLNHKGIPLWIPHALRIKISQRNLGIFRVVMTLCNLYRVLPFQGTLKLTTITNSREGSTPQEMLDFISEKFVPRVITVVPFPSRLAWSPTPLRTKGPGAEKGRNTMSGFGMALRAIFETSMASHFLQYAKSVGLSNQLNNLSIIWKGTREHCPIGPIGKLAFKQEPGKVRVFAMVDCITQWFLQPLHKYLFTILAVIKQDATFDQDKGIRLVSKSLKSKSDKSVFSFDLSAATDRLPLDIQIHILNSIRDGLGSSWGSILTDRDYILPKFSGYPKNSSVRYAVGQPMGALSSWAMLALTHHMIVQFSWASLGKNTWFTEYMVLGDDIVIYNTEVAKKYHETMSLLGVGISPTKSLSSKFGVFEFAKRLVGPEGPAQGLPLAEFAAAAFNLNVLFQAFRGKSLNPPISLFMRFLGFGYKVLGKLGVQLGDLRKRSGLMEMVAYAPNLTNKSLSKWSQFYELISPMDLYPLIEVLTYKVYSLVPPLIETSRWNMWRVLFPQFSENLIISLDRSTSLNLEMMFSNMIDRRINLYNEKYKTFVDSINRTELDTSSWTSLDKLVSLMETAPTSVKEFTPDMDEVGELFSLSDDTLMGVSLTLSLPISVMIKAKSLQIESIKWSPPIEIDTSAEDWDIQILD